MIFFEKLHQIIQQITKWKNRVFRKKQTLYLSILALFVVGFVFLTSSVLWMSGGKKYISLALGKPQSFGQATIEVVDRQYNKDKKLYIETLFIPKETQTNSNEIRLSTESVTKQNPSKALKAKIKNIDNQMYVLIIKDLPAGFETLKHSITNTKGNSSLYEYVNETQIPNNPNLVIKSKKAYEIDSVQYEIELVKRDIDRYEKKIRKFEKTNKQLDKDIESTKKEMNFQTTDEQQNSIASVKQFENQKLENTKMITEAKVKIQSNKEKIRLLLRKIYAIENNKKIKEVEIPEETTVETYKTTETTSENDSDIEMTDNTTESSSSLAMSKLFPNKDDADSSDQTTKLEE